MDGFDSDGRACPPCRVWRPRCVRFPDSRTLCVHSDLLHRLIGKDAEDATQKTFLAAWRSHSLFDTSRPIRPWLFAIARNEARKSYRSSRGVPFVGDPEFAAPLPSHVVHDLESQSRVRALLANLPEDQRVAMLLRFQEGFTPNEIAEIEGVSVNAIRIRLSKAIRALRIQIGER